MTSCRWIVAFLGMALATVWLSVGVSHAASQSDDIRIADSTGVFLNSCLRRVAPGDTFAQVYGKLDAFSCAAERTEQPDGDYWVLSAPIDTVSNQRQPLNVRIAGMWAERVTLYIVRKDGRVDRFDDDPIGLSRRVQIGAFLQYPLTQTHAPVDRLLWKVEGTRKIQGLRASLRIATEAESLKASLTMTAFYACFAGLCIALFVYSIALWATLRYRFHLAYAAMLAALLAYVFSASGALAWAYPDISNTVRLRLNGLFMSAGAAAAIWFARDFFEEHVFGPRLRLLTRVTIAALLTSGVTFAIFAERNPTVFAYLYNSALAATLIPIAAIVYSAWAKRSNFLWLFAVAWAAPIIAACIRLLAGFGFVESRFWLENATLVSMAAEALISSVAIAYRIRMLRHERDAAVAAETVARRLAEIDPLTGLLNRRAFLGRAIGRPSLQTLQILDLDRFKQINETIGHDGGDEVLRVVARILRATAPEGALVARLGGEEFVVLCDSSAPLDAELILTRLRSTRMPFDLRVTASIGTATGPIMDEPQWKNLYCTADQALFDAKANGRDRVKTARARAA